MNPMIEWAVLILVSVSAVMAVASYFATRREVDDVKTRLGKMEDEPDSFERFVSKPEFSAHIEHNRHEHENLFKKLGGVERGTMSRMDAISQEFRAFVTHSVESLVKSNNDGRGKLHERINEILVEVSEIRGELKSKGKT